MDTKTAIPHYLAYLKRTRKSPRTKAAYEFALEKYRLSVGDDTPLSTEAYVRFLRSIAGISPSTQAIYRTAVRTMYKFCSLDESSINFVALEFAEIDYKAKIIERLPEPNEDGINKTIAHCLSLSDGICELRDRALFVLLVDTGLRISEACNMERGQINMLERRSTVTGKGGKTAIVRISERAINALKDYWLARGDTLSGKPIDSLPVFARHDNASEYKFTKLQVSGAWYAIKKRIAEAKVDPTTIRVHDLRHYFVTIVYRHNNDIKLAQELARHADIGTTERYTHLGAALDKDYDEIFNGKDRDNANNNR